MNPEIKKYQLSVFFTTGVMQITGIFYSLNGLIFSL